MLRIPLPSLASPLALVSLALTLAACSADPGDGDSERVYRPEIGVSTISANGIEVAYFEEGQGPLVLLLHGFPDTPHTFDEIRGQLAEAGYRAVSPFMRGYAPSEIPAGNGYDAEALGNDVLGLIAALGEDQAIVVGHDWGATAAYAAAALDPERVAKLVTIAIPHPISVAADPDFLTRAPHFVYLAGADAEALMRADDFAHVDELYARWSPTWSFEPGELEPVKNTFSAPGSLTGALGYYRAITPTPPEIFLRPIASPTLTFAGRDDGVTPVAAFDDARAAFSGSYRVVETAGGHFLHRESPAELMAELRDFLAAP